jgi:hypothetical protein
MDIADATRKNQWESRKKRYREFLSRVIKARSCPKGIFLNLFDKEKGECDFL